LSWAVEPVHPQAYEGIAIVRECSRHIEPIGEKSRPRCGSSVGSVGNRPPPYPPSFLVPKEERPERRDNPVYGGVLRLCVLRSQRSSNVEDEQPPMLGHPL